MLTIDKPKYGWSKLTIQCHGKDCNIALSYIDDIALYFLNKFLDYLENVENAEDTLVLTIDEEGNTKKIIADVYQTYIIDEGTETLFVSDLSVLQFISICISEFKKNLSDWADFAIFDEFETNYKTKVKNKEKELETKIQIISKMLNSEL